MADREKVIKMLRYCAFHECDAFCPYWVGCDHHSLTRGAFELLKTKRPVVKSDMYFCADCKTALPKTHNYCYNCGREVKWDE